MQTLSGHSDWVSSIAWSSDGKLLATASRDKTAKVFEVGTGRSRTTFSGHRTSVRGVVFASDDQRVYSSDSEGVLSLWKIADAGKGTDVTNGAGEVFRMTATDKVVFLSAAGQVRQYDKSSNKEIRSFDGHRDWVLSVAVDCKQERVASGGFNGQVHVWNIAKGTSLVEFTAAPGYAQGTED
jgi:WD40 repeat protein